MVLFSYHVFYRIGVVNKNFASQRTFRQKLDHLQAGKESAGVVQCSFKKSPQVPKFGCKSYLKNDPIRHVNFEIVRPNSNIKLATIKDNFDIKRGGVKSHHYDKGINFTHISSYILI